MNYQAMAFYHSDGFVPSWELARKYAGEGGHIATIPDIIDARLRSGYDDPAWHSYFTTTSFEVLGYSKAGHQILIIGHGNKPVASYQSIMDSYSYQFKDKTGERRGGRLSKYEFEKLESGKFGPVTVVDLKDHIRRFKYPFIEPIQSDEAFDNPLVKARLGSNFYEYIKLHKHMAIAHENKQGLSSWHPFILDMDDASNLPYLYFDQISPDGLPLFHLLAIGGMMSVNYCEYCGSKLITEIGPHSWNEGTRFVGVPKYCPLKGIKSAPSAHDILHKHWNELWLPEHKGEVTDFVALTKVGDYWFSMYEKKGNSMDTYEPEFQVTSIEKIGLPTQFITKIAGYYGFYTYDLKELRGISPQAANSYYFTDEPTILDNDHHVVTVQFCKSTFDSSKRLRRVESIWHDPELMMKFAVLE